MIEREAKGFNLFFSDSLGAEAADAPMEGTVIALYYKAYS